MRNFFSKENERLVFILVTMFLNFLGFSIIIPILPFLVEKFIPNPNHLAFYVGILLSVYSLCQFLASPGLGALSDLWGRRPILLVSLFGSIIGYLLLAFGGAFWVLLLGRVIDGLTGGNISTVYAYLADITEPKERIKYYGMVGAAGGFGFMIGPAIGGFIGAVHLSAPLLFAAGITFLNMIFGYFVLPESLKKEHKLEKFELNHLNPFGHLFDLFSINLIKKLFTSTFFYYLALFGIYGITSIYAKDVFHWGTVQIGILLFSVGIIDILSQGYLIRKLIPKLGEVKVGILGLILASLGFLTVIFTAFYTSVVLFYIAFMILNVGDGLIEPALSGLVANSVGPRLQGRVQGGSQSVQSMARILGPIVSAWAYYTWRGLPYLSATLLSFVALFVLIIAIPTIKSHKVHDAFPERD